MTFTSESVLAAGERRKCCDMMLTLFGYSDTAIDRTHVNTYIHHIRLLEKVPHEYD
jgi:hypothetical protein